MKHDPRPGRNGGDGRSGDSGNSGGNEPTDHDRDTGPGLPDDDDGRDLFADVERRALYDLPGDDDEDDAAPDLVGSLSEDAGADSTADTAAAAHDVTLGGYIEKHNRVPAFDGSDGQPYTVDIDVEEDGDDEAAAFVGFLIFIRWAATGAGIMDHLESGDIARGATAEDARRGVLDLSLYEIKAELDAAIARRREALED